MSPSPQLRQGLRSSAVGRKVPQGWREHLCRKGLRPEEPGCRIEEGGQDRPRIAFAEVLAENERLKAIIKAIKTLSEKTRQAIEGIQVGPADVSDARHITPDFEFVTEPSDE